MKSKIENRQSWYLEENKPIVRLAFGKPPLDIGPLVFPSEEVDKTGYVHREHDVHYDAGWGDSDTLPDLPSTSSISTRYLGVLKLTSDLRIIDEGFGSMIQSQRMRATTFIANKIGTAIIKHLSNMKPMNKQDLIETVSIKFNMDVSSVEQFVRVLLALSWLEES